MGGEVREKVLSYNSGACIKKGRSNLRIFGKAERDLTQDQCPMGEGVNAAGSTKAFLSPRQTGGGGGRRLTRGRKNRS